MQSIKNLGAIIGFRTTIAIIALFAALTGTVSAPAFVSADGPPEAITLVSNFDRSTNFNNNLGSSYKKFATSLVTGEHADGYVITDVRIRMGDGDGNEVVKVRLYADDENRPTDSHFYTFASPASIPSGDNSETIFTAANELNLEPSTKYWLSVEVESGQISTALTTNRSQSGETGWTIGNKRAVVGINISNPWSDGMVDAVLKFKVQGYETPAPVTMVSNLNQRGNVDRNLAKGKRIALPFTTPDYGSTLDEVNIKFTVWRAGTTLEAKLRLANGKKPTGPTLATLNIPSSGFGIKSFRTTSETQLLPNTQYMIVLSRAADDVSGAIRLKGTRSDDQDASSQDGWTIRYRSSEQARRDIWRWWDNGVVLFNVVATYGTTR